MYIMHNIHNIYFFIIIIAVMSLTLCSGIWNDRMFIFISDFSSYAVSLYCAKTCSVEILETIAHIFTSSLLKMEDQVQVENDSILDVCSTTCNNVNELTY